jgi:hypothetical protein
VEVCGLTPLSLIATQVRRGYFSFDGEEILLPKDADNAKLLTQRNGVATPRSAGSFIACSVGCLDAVRLCGTCMPSIAD